MENISVLFDPEIL